MLRELFDGICRALERGGPFRVDAVESGINLIAVHHFGGVRVRRDHLRVGFLVSETIESARIERTQRIGPRRVLHHVLVRSKKDVDRELLGWLERARAEASGA
jgi:hypothetical protein